MPKTYGYIRVSTLGQDLTVQREALIGAGDSNASINVLQKVPFKVLLGRA